MFPHCLIFIKHLVTGWTSELIVNLKQNINGILKELVTFYKSVLAAASDV